MPEPGRDLRVGGQSGRRAHLLADRAGEVIRFPAMAASLRAVAAPALRHRMILNFEGEAEGITTEAVVRSILDAVVAPTVE